MLIKAGAGARDGWALRRKGSDEIDLVLVDQNLDYLFRLQRKLQESKPHLGEFEVVPVRVQVAVVE